MEFTLLIYLPPEVDPEVPHFALTQDMGGSVGETHSYTAA